MHASSWWRSCLEQACLCAPVLLSFACILVSACVKLNFCFASRYDIIGVPGTAGGDFYDVCVQDSAVGNSYFLHIPGDCYRPLCARGLNYLVGLSYCEARID